MVPFWGHPVFSRTGVMGDRIRIFDVFVPMTLTLTRWPSYENLTRTSGKYTTRAASCQLTTITDELFPGFCTDRDRQTNTHTDSRRWKYYLLCQRGWCVESYYETPMEFKPSPMLWCWHLVNCSKVDLHFLVYFYSPGVTSWALFIVIVCPMQFMALDRYKITWVFVCVFVCPQNVSSTIATTIFVRCSWNLERGSEM